MTDKVRKTSFKLLCIDMRSASPDCTDKCIAFAAAKFGISTEEQDQAICTFVEGSDVFTSLPTGYRKSLCFVKLPFVYRYEPPHIIKAWLLAKLDCRASSCVCLLATQNATCQVLENSTLHIVARVESGEWSKICALVEIFDILHIRVTPTRFSRPFSPPPSKRTGPNAIYLSACIGKQ